MRIDAEGRRHLDANGLRVGYDAVGEGPPLVLLHGASSTGREDFGAQLPRLGRSFACYLPDARGHARTVFDARAGLRLDDLVADLEAFADAIGLAAFHLAGFSMGGATALAFAIRRPDRLRSLVLIGTATEREPRTRVIRHQADVARIERQEPGWAAALARRHDPAQGEGAWRRLMPAIADLVAGQEPPTPADLRRVDVPALVVVGDRDPVVPVGQAWALARQLPDARLFVVPGAPHAVTARRPGLVLEGLLGFYRSIDAAEPRADG
ncbi:MAG: alpha/beta hydrolase [Chloroflexi bacterium]|nr:alpha/beta hydrolase [Chloroflexota bacterium]